MLAHVGPVPVEETRKSKLKSLPCEDAQRNDQPMRSRWASISPSGARDTAVNMTSWCSRCTCGPFTPSAIEEQLAQTSSAPGGSMKW